VKNFKNHTLCVIRKFKSRGKKWTEHVTRKGNGSLQNSHLEDRKEDGEVATRRYTLRK
jgi:hypothetical protein